MKKSNSSLVSILNSTSAGIIYLKPILDRDSKIIDFKYDLVNDAAESLLGLNKSIVGSNYIENNDNNSKYEIFNKLVEVVEKNVTLEFLEKKDNNVLFNVNASPYLEGVILTYSKILSRKKLVNSLEESENYYKTIFENTGMAMAIVEEDTKFSLVNSEFEKITGYSKEEILGKSGLKLIFNEEKDKLIKYHKLRLSHPERAPQNYEVKVVDKKGNFKDVLITATIIPGTKKTLLSVLDITEKKRSRNILKDREKQLSLLTDNMADIIGQISPSWKIEYISPSIKKILGYNVEDFKGKTIFEFMELVHKQEKEMIKKIFPKLKNKKHSISIEYRNKTSKGNYKWIEAVFSPIYYKNEFNGYIFSLRDIEKRKKVENKLKKSEESYRTIVDTANEGIWVMDKDFITIYVNRKMAEMLGYITHEMVNRRITDFMLEEELADNELRLKNRVLGIREQYERKFYHKDGSIRWLIVSATPLQDSRGNFAGSFAMCTDLTEEKTTKKILKERESRLSAIFDLAGIAMGLSDADGRMIETNRYFHEMLGYTDEELKKFTYKDVTHPDDLNTTEQHLKDLISGKIDSYRIEKRYIRKDCKVIWVDLSVTPIRDEKNNFLSYIAAAVDITELKKAENALRESENYYRTIFENTGTASIIIEKDSTISLVNSESEKLFGYTKKEIEGKLSWKKFVSKKDLKKMKEYHRLRRIDPDNAPRNYEFQFIDKYGTVRDILATIAMIPNTNKSLASLVDITERNRSRGKLKWELKVNQSLANIYSPIISPVSSIEKISSTILKEAKVLTKSPFGYVAEIDPNNQDMILHSIDQIMDRQVNDKLIFSAGEDGSYDGLWGYSLNTKRGFFTNQAHEHHAAEGTPPSHFEIEKFLSVPVILKNQLVGQISLANSSENYSTNKLDAVKRLAEFFALAIQRHRAEEKIKESLAEKKILLQEIHHRVKNNMQIISSLLNLQTQYLDDKEAINVLKESQNRVKSMAMIHEKLYLTRDFSQINFGEYIRSLVSDLYYSYAVKSSKIKPVIIAEDIILGIETAIPCGLIINELVSNTLKYAFPGDKTGNLSVVFRRINGKYELIISDEGIGLPDDFDIKETKTLGLKLVNSLVDQIDGDIHIEKDQTSFHITFEELEYKERI
ncbi:MAG: PAS domain S-box protein [Methanomicrobiales archaeon]